MISFIKKYWLFILAFIIPLVVYFPSLSGFYTNDEFFLLKVARVSSVKDFLNFFSLVKDSAGLGAYRPLTLRAYYFLTVQFFNLNPIPLHIISFITFFTDIFLVGYLTKLLTKNIKIAALCTFLYATSVTHFGQLYYLGAFQELFLGLTFLTSVIFSVKRKLVLSILFFILALMSKESAVVLPLVLVIVYFYLKAEKRVKISTRELILSLLPYFIILAAYLFLHFRYFGVVKGDSYVWNFSPMRALNTLAWYFLWSLNLPEMLVDFFGPGIRLNPNLMRYWSGQIVPIFVLFSAEVVVAAYAFFGTKFSKGARRVWVFHILWFLATLLPVLFLPLHKFSFYLVLPLFAITFFLSYIFHNQKPAVYILFCIVWTALSLSTLRLTLQTNWITQGTKVASRVYVYFQRNQNTLASRNIVFVDTPADSNLPWSPTATLKTVLSGKDFFDVFYPSLSSHIHYSGTGDVTIKSRQFLGY
jgi:hypothetical protein